MADETIRITGRVVDVRDGSRPAPGLRVEAWDLDFFRDDYLGAATTDETGEFLLEFNPRRGREPFDRYPDLYFKIYDGDRLLENTEESVHWNLRDPERHLELEVGRVPAPAGALSTRAFLAREQSDRLLGPLLQLFDECILMIPPDRLDFRATPETMTARQLAHHVYQTVLTTYRALELGKLDRADLEFLELDVDSLGRPEEIVRWGERVKEHARAVAAQLSEPQLDQPLRYHFGTIATGWESLRRAVEETLHHRGQLMLYLRLMGRVPPRVDHS